jgi:hypothetical protein
MRSLSCLEFILQPKYLLTFAERSDFDRTDPGRSQQKWDAPSSAVLAWIMKRNSTSSMRISDKWCTDQKREDIPRSRARSPRWRPGKLCPILPRPPKKKSYVIFGVSSTAPKTAAARIIKKKLHREEEISLSFKHNVHQNFLQLSAKS